MLELGSNGMCRSLAISMIPHDAQASLNEKICDSNNSKLSLWIGHGDQQLEMKYVE